MKMFFFFVVPIHDNKDLSVKETTTLVIKPQQRRYTQHDVKTVNK